MKTKDILKIKENLNSITLIQMRDLEFSAELTRLYVLVGDLVTMVRRPKNTLSLLDNEVKVKAAGRTLTKRNKDALVGEGVA